MNAVNLLSTERRRLRVIRRRVRRWQIVALTWSVGLVVVAALIAHGDRRTAPEDIRSALAASEDRRAVLGDEVKRLKSRMAANATRLAAVQATTDHPDWSRLLVRVVNDRPASLRFSRWELSHRSGALTLRLEGDVADVAALTEFVMRLEQVPAFRRVSLMGATRPSDAHVTVFEIEGVIEEGIRP